MKILITGGCGFIGSAVIREVLRNTEHSVLNIDKLTYAASPENLRGLDDGARYAFSKSDITDKAAMMRLFSEFKPDAVMHLAAESHVDRSIDGPGDFISANIVGTYTMLEAARAYYAKLPADGQARFRFLHISTDEVYGSLGPADFFTETSRYKPNSPYSASKASSDMLVRAWPKTYGLPVLVTNCSNNYGCFQFPEKLIPVVILSALEGRRIPIYGTGENIRDWLFVEDHARALLTVLEKGAVGETYLVGGNSERTNLQIADIICGLMDEFVPRPGGHKALLSFVADRPGHDKRYAIDASRIARELDWRPQVSFEEGMRLTVKWYLENRWWWELIRSRGFTAERVGLKLEAP